MEPSSTPVRPLTWLGIALALLGVPVLIFISNQLIGERPLQNDWVLMRETAIFALTGLLLLLIVKGERLGLDSIGLHNRHWGKSLLWALIGLVASFAVGAATILLLQACGVSFGEGGESARYENVSLWAITLMVLRAGVVEEICYRGYLMERLGSISKNPLLYFWLPLVLFALWHYRQGVGGIVISFTLGAVLAVMYWKKRDLKANIITHFLVDFIPNVLVALIAGNYY